MEHGLEGGHFLSSAAGLLDDLAPHLQPLRRLRGAGLSSPHSVRRSARRPLPCRREHRARALGAHGPADALCPQHCTQGVVEAEGPPCP